MQNLLSSSSLRHTKKHTLCGCAFSYGAEKRIRTSGPVLPVTRFPIVLLKPLRHLGIINAFFSKALIYITVFFEKMQAFSTKFHKFMKTFFAFYSFPKFLTQRRTVLTRLRATGQRRIVSAAVVIYVAARHIRNRTAYFSRIAARNTFEILAIRRETGQFNASAAFYKTTVSAERTFHSTGVERAFHLRHSIIRLRLVLRLRRTFHQS